MNDYTISHIRKNKDGSLAFQSNEEHSKGVAELAKQFAYEFDMGEWGYVMGMLHDKGKEKHEFQEYIQDVNGILGHENYTQKGKAHAYVGGLQAKELYPWIYPLIGNPIFGHHRGLYDYNDLEEEQNREWPIELCRSKIDVDLSFPQWMQRENVKSKDFHHIQRMLFSCLVDADYLDTEKFMQPQHYKLRLGKACLQELLPRLNAYLTKFGEPTTNINKIRCEIQRYCMSAAFGAPGFYSLTVPTGGGKTLSSLVWAINHAIYNGKRRIIIAIPYTSIIVQTASILRNIFGDNNVLEHHNNADTENIKDERLKDQMRLATENWDYPIVVTTNVQLFESMMASHSSKCRKLHNISNSVLILDEVQTLSTEFLQPIVDSLDTYQRLFGLSVLFTTASQPVLTSNHHGVNQQVVFKGLNQVKEIIRPEANLHARLRRVELDINDTPSTYDEIVERLIYHERVLCIVNTRHDAKEIFDRLPQDGINIHLSRMMCPMHISVMINNIKTALKDKNNKVVRVVATQLIEAGVDIDFPVVYRQEAGLDSILQAAGRCNREGMFDVSTTHVFSLAHEHTLPRGHITQCNNARKNMVGDYDWFSPQAMSDYFLQLYSRVQSFDKDDIEYHLYNPRELLMQTYAEKFQLIDDATIPVIVNWKNSFSLTENLKSNGPSYPLCKKLSQYSVNIRKHDFDTLKNEGIISEIIEGYYCIENKSQYKDDVGLLTENQLLEETFIL